MANEFKIKHGFISTGNGSVEGEIRITGAGYADNGNRIATRPWVLQYLSSNSYATSTDISDAIDALVASAPGTLDTLNELAAALGDDPNFSTTVSNSIATKLPLAGGTMSGNIRWTSTERGLEWVMNTDGAGIKFYNTGDSDTNSRLEYYTTDNGNEYHRFMVAGNEEMTIKSDGIRVTNNIYMAGNIVATQSWVSTRGYGQASDITAVNTRIDEEVLPLIDTKADSSHNHDSRYLVKGGSWNGVNMPGSRWGGFSVNGGEVVFQRDNPNNGQMSVMVDGNFYAGERNGFWSLYSNSPSHNNYNEKVGFYSNTSGHFLISTSAVYAGGNQVWHAGNLTNNSSNWDAAYGWGDHASAGYLTSLPSHNHDDRYYTESESDSRFANVSHKYHSFANGSEYYDSYGQSNYLRMFTENATFDTFRFRPYSNVQRYDGSNWVSWGQNLDSLFNGQEHSGFDLTHENSHFRFEIQRSSGWPTTALFVIQSSWSDTANYTCNVTLETLNGEVWEVKDNWDYSNFQRGINLHTTTQTHDGRVNMRVTINMNWEDRSHSNFPIRRILFLSNFSGSAYDMRPFVANYDKSVTFANQIYVSGGNSSEWNTAYSWGNHADENYLTSLPSHNHDDRYYTETEMDTKLAQRVSTGGDTISGSLNITDGIPHGSEEPYTEYSKVIFDNSHSNIARGPNKIVMHDNGSGWAGGFGIHSSTVAYYTGDKHSWYKSNTNGTFTERMTLDASGNLSIDGTLSASGYNKSDWDAAYGWGNHANAGYLTSADGGNAQTLDGINSTSFLRSDATDTFTGYLIGNRSDENLRVSGIRGQAKGSQTGEYIHLYERVHIGGPNGWGAAAHGAPSYGLSVWGSVNFGMNGSGVIQLDDTTIVNASRNLVNVGGNISMFTNDAGYLTSLPSHNHDDRYYTESESDARFVNVTGDTVTGDLAISGATLSVTSTAEGSEAFFVDGVNGRLFTISDDLSDSLFSANTISGLPVIEAFADNTVKLGPYSNPVIIDSSGNLSIGGTTAATQSYVDTAISNLVGGAPGALDTLNELAAAINDDASYASSVTSALALKAPLASPALTGNPTAPTQSASNNSTRIATTAFVKAQGYVTTDTNYYINGASFNTGNGVLTLNVSGASDVIVDLDNRYLTSVPRETGYFVKYLNTAIEMYDQASGGDLSWVIGADDRGGVNAPGQNALVFRYNRGTRFTDGGWRSEGTEAMTLDDGGRLGIGVPQAEITERLNVQGNIRGTGNLSVDGTISGSGYNSVNWDTAYSWGNHASAGYLTSYSETDTLATVTARGNTTTGDINVHGDILLTGGASGSNQARMIDFTGFDKEGTTDYSDRAYIQHTTGTGGHSGSVLVISSMNDSSDGIAFLTNASSKLKHNSNNIATEAWVQAQGYTTSTGSNYYLSGASFNTGNGVLTLNVTGASDVTVDLDNRYLLAGSKAADSNLLDGQDSTSFFRGRSGIAGDDKDSLTGNGFLTASYSGYSSQLWTVNAGGSTGTVQMEFEYNTPTRGFKIRNKTDNNTWSSTGWVVMTEDNQGHINGSIWHSGNFNPANYQAAGTYNTVIGTDSDINTSGATIIDNIYVTDGVITSMGTRTLTQADLGITTNASGNWWNGGYAVVGTDGVMEVGKYIDFHDTDTGTSDFSYRITNTGGRLYFSGDIEVDGGDLYLNDGNTRLHEAGGNALKVSTNSGYIELGPMNTGHCHIQTDRTNFYFNKQIQVDTGKVSSYNEDLQLQRAGSTRLTLGSSVATFTTPVTIPQPAPPVFGAANIVGETIEVVFDQSPTSGVDYYQVWSSVAGGAFGMITQVPTQDIAATMTAIDADFTVGGTHEYRIYAVKNGVYSEPAEGSVTFNSPTLDVVNLSVVNLNTAYYIQYDMPDSRFVDHIEIYMDAENSSGSLSRSDASLIYSGNNTSYMYQIGASDLDKFHQFWVEVVES